ncbi:MAG: hypothetical protein HYS18_05525 [Burkholderiales bacterium]|nr:hypothetical protein [Burkholderiales bacterium]
MAITDREARNVYVESPADAIVSRRPLFSAVRWGAILAGVAAGVSVQLVLTLLGIATGLSAADVNSANRGMAMGAMLWAGISMLIAAFVGGYVAARMSGLKRKADGVLHGMVAWAVTTLLFATLAASAGGSLLGGIFNAMGPTVMQASSSGSSPVGAMLRSQAARIDANALQRVQSDIEAGRRDDAIRSLSEATGMDPTRAAAIVDQALIVSGLPEQASPQARIAANRAVENAGATAWALFAAVALALAIAMTGGVVGAAGSRRTTWTGSTAARAA